MTLLRFCVNCQQIEMIYIVCVINFARTNFYYMIHTRLYIWLPFNWIIIPSYLEEVIDVM